MLADLGHVAAASQVRIDIEATRVPISDHLRELWGDGIEARLRASTAGDDYEVAFTVASSGTDAVLEAGRRTETQVTEIGRVVSGGGLALLDENGNPVPVARAGYTHF